MNQSDDLQINQAIAALRDGGVVAFPTDTVYGVGVDPFQPDAVRKLYQIKGRPIDKPIPILVGSVSDVERVAQNLPPTFSRLAEQFWPGELTLIVEAKSLPPEITAGGDTVGVRMPDHPLALALLQRFGGAIATTSANKSDEPPATSAEEVRSELGALVGIILDGGQTTTKIASTVLDLSVSPPQIRRDGGISMDQLTPFLR
ncbi:threonylcarbamoyl-AMP synthase [Candidatus Poribacteria bacterium]|nr:MAG: threonylcarbamoyl-AMP synthase [Candidatus Poribacteria bacterium]